MNETLIKKTKVQKPTKSCIIYSSKVIVFNYYDSSVEFQKDRIIGTLFSYLQKQPLDVFIKIDVLKILQNSQENTCARVSFLIKLQACNFIKKETLAQVFSCEFCEIFKNTF